MKITVKTVEAVSFSKPNPSDTDYHWDDTLKGFAVRVYPSGRKSFYVVYRNAANEKRFYKLGDYPAVKVPQARDMAEKIFALVAQGGDPQSERQEKRSEITYQELAERYLAHYKDKKKAWRNDNQRMRDHILPALGSKKLSSITLMQLQKLQTKLCESHTPATANRCTALIKHSFTIAVQWGLIAESPAKHMKLYREPPPRDIVLTPGECQRIFNACGDDENLYAGALFRTALLTGRRIGELLQAKWKDYDAKNICLVLHDTKAGERQFAVLNSTASAILDKLPPMVGNPYIFAGASFAKPLNTYAKAWRRILKRAEVAYFPPHGLRHNYASMLVAAGEPLEVVGHLLGHKTSVTTRRYSHHRPEGLRKSAERLTNVIGFTHGNAQ